MTLAPSRLKFYEQSPLYGSRRLYCSMFRFNSYLRLPNFFANQLNVYWFLQAALQTQNIANLPPAGVLQSQK